MNDELAKQLRQSVADFYESQGAAFGRTRAIVWNEEKLVAKRIESGMTVVDIGAGNGRFARLLPPDTTYIGFEPSSSLRASANPDLDLREGGFPRVSISDESADVVTSFAVIQHLPTLVERQLAVDELVRIAKPDSLLAATSWHPTPELTRQTITPLPEGEPEDVLVSWNAEDAAFKRYIHDFSFAEWQTLWQRPDLRIEQCGLFVREDWTEDLTQGRNWYVIARKK
jgi:ubiquinone/menaquinone biosynthesis C-methylase UbiE